MKKVILDVRGKVCPWPALLAKERLKLMKPGDMLEVIADYPLAKENVQRVAEGLGCKVLEVREERGQFSMMIEKKSPSGRMVTERNE
jgi:tRNA 2-thiouridine synthesizing protein A